MTNHTSRTASRRELFAPAAAAATLLFVGSAAQAQTAAKAAAPAAKPAASPRQGLIDAAKKCATTGDVCLKHCIRLTKAGDTSLAGCMAAVQAMLPVCAAAGKLASLDAKRLKDIVKVCADVCADCEAECRKHEFHHKECKACAESCAAMVKEAKALLAA